MSACRASNERLRVSWSRRRTRPAPIPRRRAATSTLSSTSFERKRSGRLFGAGHLHQFGGGAPMKVGNSSGPADPTRRHFLEAAAAIAASPFVITDFAMAQSTGSTRSTSFGSLKQIDAGALRVEYADVGPARGRPVILLHGWPY